MAHVRNWEKRREVSPKYQYSSRPEVTHLSLFRACLRIRYITQNAEHGTMVCSYARRPLLFATTSFSWWPREHPKGNIICFVKANLKLNYIIRDMHLFHAWYEKILHINVIGLLVSRHFRIIIIIVTIRIKLYILIITYQI